MIVKRRLAWILFLMALPGLLLAMRLHHWKKLRSRLACAAQIERLEAAPVSEGLTKRDTLARELAELRRLPRHDGDQAARRCRHRLVLLPGQARVVCLRHGLPPPAPARAQAREPAGWLDPTTGAFASPRQQLELAGVADRELLVRASDRNCGHGCAAGPTWFTLILGVCLAYSWALLRALRGLFAAVLGWPDPFTGAEPPGRAGPPSGCLGGIPPLPGV